MDKLEALLTQVTFDNPQHVREDVSRALINQDAREKTWTIHIEDSDCAEASDLATVKHKLICYVEFEDDSSKLLISIKATLPKECPCQQIDVQIIVDNLPSPSKSGASAFKLLRCAQALKRSCHSYWRCYDLKRLETQVPGIIRRFNSLSLYFAAEDGEVRSLLKTPTGRQQLRLDMCYGSTHLQAAAGAGHVKIVEELLDAGADINACGPLDSTPLTRACKGGHVDVVRLLLHRNARLRWPNVANCWLPIHAAAKRGNMEIIKMILAKDQSLLDIESHDFNLDAKITPLCCAVNEGHVEVMKELITLGARTDARAMGCVIHKAVSDGKTECAQQLLEIESNVNLKLHGYIILGRMDIVEHLLSLGASVLSPDWDDKSALYNALQGLPEENRTIMELLLDYDAEVTMGEASLWTTIVIADEMNQDCVHYLLRAGLEVSRSCVDDCSEEDEQEDEEHSSIVPLIWRRIFAGRE